MADLGTALQSELNVVNTYFTNISNSQYGTWTFGYIQSEIDVLDTYSSTVDYTVINGYSMIFSIVVDGLVDRYQINPETYEQRV